MHAEPVTEQPLKRHELRDLMYVQLIAEYIGSGPTSRRFGVYPGNDAEGRGIATAMASYLDGYATGYTWTYNYHPGGPFVGGGSKHPRLTKDHDYDAFIKAQNENYEEFHRGFRDGQARVPITWPQLEHLAILGYN